MKKSEIKDLYNQSDESLKLLKAMALILPFCNGEQTTAKATLSAAAQAAALFNPVKAMCDYMIDDGSIDMAGQLQNIKAEVSQIEQSVAKMGNSIERMQLSLNCRAIINQIKDVEVWTANHSEPQQKDIAAPQQPNEGSGGELAGNGNETRPDEKPDDDESQYIELPDILKISDMAQPVFTEAIAKGWMEINEERSAKWIGVTKPNKNGKVVAKWRQLAYLCGVIYGFKYDLVNNQYGNQGDPVPWTELQKYFNINNKVNLSKEYAGAMEATKRIPGWRKVIDKLIDSISI